MSEFNVQKYTLLCRRLAAECRGLNGTAVSLWHPATARGPTSRDELVSARSSAQNA